MDLTIQAIGDRFRRFDRLLHTIHHSPRFVEENSPSFGKFYRSGTVLEQLDLKFILEVSDLAARTALAAKRQGAYVAFHQRLMRAAFAPTPDYITELVLLLSIKMVHENKCFGTLVRPPSPPGECDDLSAPGSGPGRSR